jgi:hypothetical protein
MFVPPGALESSEGLVQRPGYGMSQQHAEGHQEGILLV